MESFGKVGVQRPLRRYEHVRDVMNSWDDDKQNALTIVPSATGGNDPDLDAKSVLKDEPLEFGCALQYSQRPGKWDKKWVTLRPDGQVTIAKKEGMKATDHTSVCHISDFDIYTPSQKQLAKKIKPPKKHCFAIKSQQKSAMFETLESFVHFFCTNDRKTAAGFYRAIQGWRSWYLVNVMGAGQAVRDKAAAALDRPIDNNTPDTVNAHNRGDIKDSHYQLGSFKPLIDFDTLASNPSSGGTSHGRQKASQTQNAPAPPSSYSRFGQSPHQQYQASAQLSSAAFSPGGLLGHTYSQRQKAAEARDQATQLESPFMNDGLLQKHDPTNSVPTGSTATALKRASSRRAPRPLVSLSEEPAHMPAKRGKAFVPESVGTGGLIESAKSRDLPASTPASKPPEAAPRTRPDLDPAEWSASEGLLAGVSHSQGATGGRGIATGADAAARGRPLIDPRDASEFAEGSLLRRVEEREGVRLPVIERGKGREVKVGTGEGFS